MELMRQTRSDLNETALMREKAARLELELKHAREAATAPPAVADPTLSSRDAPGVTSRDSPILTASELEQPPISLNWRKRCDIISHPRL